MNFYTQSTLIHTQDVLGYLPLLIQEPRHIENELNRKTRDKPTTYTNSCSTNRISNQCEKDLFNKTC